MIIHAAIIVFVLVTPIGDASAVPFRASAAVSRIIIAFVVVDGIMIDVARTYMRRIVTAAVVVGIIISEIGRTYTQLKPWAVATMFDLNHIIPGAFGGIQKGLPGRRGIGHWGKPP
jgi:hypothetical protein